MSQSTESKNQQSQQNENRAKQDVSRRRIEDHSHGESCHKPTSCGRVNVGEQERIVSTAGGAIIGAYGLVRSGPIGWLLAVVGASLIYRGVSGHCSAYKALDINTAHHQ